MKRIIVIVLALVGASLLFASPASAANLTLASPGSPTCKVGKLESGVQYYNCTTALPQTFVFVSSARGFQVGACGNNGNWDLCDPKVVTSGPDQDGRYRHEVKLYAAPEDVENHLAVSSGVAKSNIAFKVTRNSSDIEDLSYRLRQLKRKDGQCVVRSQMAFHLAEPFKIVMNIKVQTRRNGRWKTVASRHQDGFGGRYLGYDIDMRVKAAKHKLGKRNRTVIRQKVKQNNGPTVYHQVKKTQKLSRQCR